MREGEVRNIREGCVPKGLAVPKGAHQALPVSPRERTKGLAEQHVTSTLASLNTLNGARYKTFLQETIGGWYSLFPEVRAAPRAGRASLDGEEGVDVEEPEEGEEGFIGGEVPVL